MRAAYVYAGNAPVFGTRGASVHMQEVMRALARGGATVELLAKRVRGSALPGMDGVRRHRLRRPGRAGGDAGDDLAADPNEELRRRLAGLGQLDLVYERFSLGSFAAMEHAGEAGIPGILEVNGPRVEKAAARGALADRDSAEAAAARAVGAAAAVVAVSEGVAEQVREKYGAGSRVHVLPNGVDPARFPASLIEERERARRPFTVGFVGTFKAHHGLDHLVEGFLRLREARPDARLLLVGEGAERTGVEALLRERGAGDAARFPGAVPPAEVGRLLGEMDVGVAPYPARRSYVSPLKVFEYMAAGLAVVASGVDQLADVVRHGETGLLVEPEDPAALVGALDLLAGDPGMRARMGAAGRATVLSGHTWDAVASRILELARVAPAR